MASMKAQQQKCWKFIIHSKVSMNRLEMHFNKQYIRYENRLEKLFNSIAIQIIAVNGLWIVGCVQIL